MERARRDRRGRVRRGGAAEAGRGSPSGTGLILSLTRFPRSFLYAPGHDSARLEAAFDHGADAVVFDLEDGVPPVRRDQARDLVAEALRSHPAWVRINPAGTAEAEDDLDAIQGIAAGIRLPKTASADDARWLVERVPGTPVICSIESKQGLLAASAIASVAGVATLLARQQGPDRRPRLRRRLGRVEVRT